MQLFRHISAVRLRMILVATLFILTAGAATVVYLANQSLSQAADDTSKAVADAEASQNNLQDLQQIQKALNDRQDIVKRADNIVANSQNYQYQNQIINDLKKYADIVGISLVNIDFSTSNSGSTTSGATPAAKSTPVPAGVKTATINVTVKNPTSYPKLLTFMKAIEENLTKMQIARINLTQDATGTSSDVLSITVYVR